MSDSVPPSNLGSESSSDPTSLPFETPIHWDDIRQRIAELAADERLEPRSDKRAEREKALYAKPKEEEAKEADLQNLLGREDVADRQSDRGMREGLANKILSLAKWWALGVFIILILCLVKFHASYKNGGFSTDLHLPGLSDSVLIALLSATSILGLVAIVLRNLFPSKAGESKTSKKETPAPKAVQK